eukprot:787943-Rhodomonas_salina.2
MTRGRYPGTPGYPGTRVLQRSIHPDTEAERTSPVRYRVQQSESFKFDSKCHGAKLVAELFSSLQAVDTASQCRSWGEARSRAI